MPGNHVCLKNRLCPLALYNSDLISADNSLGDVTFVCHCRPSELSGGGVCDISNLLSLLFLQLFFKLDGE